MFDLIKQYQQMDQFGFNKNANKLGDLLIHIADSQEVSNLLSNDTIQVLNVILQKFNEKDFKGVQKTISDFSKLSDQLNAWAGQLKLMAIALSK